MGGDGKIRADSIIGATLTPAVVAAVIAAIIAVIVATVAVEFPVGHENSQLTYHGCCY